MPQAYCGVLLEPDLAKRIRTGEHIQQHICSMDFGTSVFLSFWLLGIRKKNVEMSPVEKFKKQSWV